MRRGSNLPPGAHASICYVALERPHRDLATTDHEALANAVAYTKRNLKRRGIDPSGSGASEGDGGRLVEDKQFVKPALVENHAFAVASHVSGAVKAQLQHVARGRARAFL